MLVIDTMATMLICLLWAITTIPPFLEDGLLLRWDADGWTRIWSILLTLPFALRRTKPHAAAIWFVVTVAVQLVFGPAFLFADAMALPMFYSAVVYDCRNRTREYAIMALAFDVATVAVIVFANTHGTIFGRNHMAILSGVYACAPEGAGFSMQSCAAASMESSLLYFIMFTLVLATTLVAALWQRARQHTIRMLGERNAAIAAREQEEKLIAASAERARIARDMHDIVAHTLSIIIIQSDGGRYAATHDVQLARSTMDTIRHEAEHAMHDMKQLLGVFGGSSHADYHDINALIEQAAKVSPDIHVRLELVGEPSPQLLSESASVAMYHVVQEALTNVRKYAGLNVNVEVREEWNSGTLSFTISDDGRGASAAMDGHKAGYGLLGMNERIEAVGGTVEAGPRLNGGFAVHAEVPLATSVQQAGIGSESLLQASAMHTAMHGGSSAVAVSEESGDVEVANSTGADVDDRDAQQGNDKGDHEIWPNFMQLGESLRSKPIAQIHEDGHENWITRLSHWAEHHYVLTDTILVAVTTAIIVTVPGGMELQVAGYHFSSASGAFGVMMTVLLMLPLCWRRRFPRAVALAFAILVFLQLVFVRPLFTADLAAPFIAYAAMLYSSKRGTWKWLSALIALDGLLFAFKTMLLVEGHTSVVEWMLHATPALRPEDGTVSIEFASQVFIEFAVLSIMVCLLAMALGAWVKISGSNPQVLEARAEALREEQRKQRISAANRERDRISASIQSEVSETLNSVIVETTQEISIIDHQLAQGEEPSAEWISQAFAAIGSQGRTALKRMRELLGVLRETGASDETNPSQNQLNLTPAKSLDEQISAAQSRGVGNA